jgi:hypothetical protein
VKIKLKLIKDLGTRKKNNKYVRYGLYECGYCKKHIECRTNTVKKQNQKGCASCSAKISSKEKGKPRVEKARKVFESDCRKIHGEKYGYSKVNYVNCMKKVIITCPQHGDFLQTPNNHKNGQGCPQCSGRCNKTAAKNFESDSRKIHGDKYDYSLVEYKSAMKRVKIICKIHGVFLQMPSQHKSGYGCIRCAGTCKKTAAKNFVLDGNKIHNNKYDYSRVNYVNSTTKVEIICKEHGSFWQSAGSHKVGIGCPQCAGRCPIATAKNFESDSRKIHGDKYCYKDVEYEASHKKVKIYCKIHGGYFKQTPSSHKNGQGCPSCAKSGFDYTKTGILYYLKIIHNNQVYYKIGITNKSVQKRFCSKDLDKITVLKTYKFKLGSAAYDEEQKILKLYNEYRYKGNPILESNGNTEIFTEDVLSLDPESNKIPYIKFNGTHSKSKLFNFIHNNKLSYFS